MKVLLTSADRSAIVMMQLAVAGILRWPLAPRGKVLGQWSPAPAGRAVLVGKGIVAVLREDDLVESLDPLHIVSVEDIKAEAA